MGCKKPVKIFISDHASGVKRVFIAYLHPRGCMGASSTHLDIPEDALRGTIIGAIALSRGAKIRVSTIDGCFKLEYQDFPPVVMCVEGVEPKRGVGYVKRRERGRIYLSLPCLHT
ncbi:hypothetical protein [Aeropyrum camini]|uniref:Uncharacterized protein n=1 Tax=Aeropyrum camini SY1 = JCM 12091 TaxID=1198449 RepID=U3TEY9_9CREN|nr:hypothetical protein [Aeropyrum camini]BAN91021.1 hypothetical protein ACAM_1552 [Aeropyrum camini SY1 = JCM 12091]